MAKTGRNRAFSIRGAFEASALAAANLRDYECDWSLATTLFGRALTPRCPFPNVNYLTLLFEQFLKYSTERGRMGRPVKMSAVIYRWVLPYDQALAPIDGAQLTACIGSGPYGSRARAAANHDCRARRLTR